MPKDLFSKQAEDYAKFRPVYPQELFDYILQFVQEKNIAWDCATGNGQAALALAPYFHKIIATDISQRQLDFASPHSNIEYKIAAAENTDFADDTFDLITVAQAYHWFKFEGFEKEVKRVVKNKAVIAIWGYELMYSNDSAINKLIQNFYTEITGPYWSKERIYLDNHYRNIPFNFTPLPTKNFAINVTWQKIDFIGYLNSWSAVQHFITANNYNPIDDIKEELNVIWKEEERKPFHFPVFLKLGKVNKN